MEQYLKATKMLDYGSTKISALIKFRGWSELNDYDKIGAIYRFVQNEILLGFNKSDLLTATEVLADGIGQCNTKATLFMALLRAVGIPCTERKLQNNFSVARHPDSSRYLRPAKSFTLGLKYYIKISGFAWRES